SCLLLNPPPSLLDVALCRIGLADTEAQRQVVIESSVRQVQSAALVEAVHQPLIALVPATKSEARQVQRHRRSQLKAIVLLHPFGKLPRHLDVLADVVLKTFHAVITNDEPQLQGTKPAPERDMPVPVVEHCTGFRGGVAQVFWQDAQSIDERLPFGDEETVAVEIGEHPFMRIEGVAVGEFNSVLDKAEFGTQCGRA